MKMKTENLQEKSTDLRKQILEFHKKTGRGHIGCSLSCIEILTTLYYNVMTPQDRFILSKGHASSSLYIILRDLGKIPYEKINTLEDHPEFNPDYGISATTGSLGHGLSIGLGMAIADKKNKTYVLLGDGECDEGQVWEAARVATEQRTSNLIGIIDCNNFQGFRIADNSRLKDKFLAFGWEAINCDGHDCDNIQKALTYKNKSPLAILAKTIKGKGLEEIEGKLESHYYHLK